MSWSKSSALSREPARHLLLFSFVFVFFFFFQTVSQDHWSPKERPSGGCSHRALLLSSEGTQKSQNRSQSYHL